MSFDPKRYPTEADVDRAYHPFPKGDAWRQVTFAHVESRGIRIRVACWGCHREKWTWPRTFAERHGIDMETPLLLVDRRLRCTTCGERIVKIGIETYSIEHDQLGRPRTVDE